MSVCNGYWLIPLSLSVWPSSLFDSAEHDSVAIVVFLDPIMPHSDVAEVLKSKKKALKEMNKKVNQLQETKKKQEYAR